MTAHHAPTQADNGQFRQQGVLVGALKNVHPQAFGAVMTVHHVLMQVASGTVMHAPKSAPLQTSGAVMTKPHAQVQEETGADLARLLNVQPAHHHRHGVVMTRQLVQELVEFGVSLPVWQEEIAIQPAITVQRVQRTKVGIVMMKLPARQPVATGLQQASTVQTHHKTRLRVNRLAKVGAHHSMVAWVGVQNHLAQVTAVPKQKHGIVMTNLLVQG